MTATRTVKVFNLAGVHDHEVARPAVFSAPIRPDLIRFVHSQMAKNARQPYGISVMSGMQSPATSWGPGRAVARVPRVPGSGTRRCGQAALINMARGGRMFGPVKVTRRWHRKINVGQRRYAVASAIAATSCASLVDARGHQIGKVKHLPLVIENKFQAVKTTKEVLAVLEKLGVERDVSKVKNTVSLRPGKGKYRNRRYRVRRGPLIVYLKNEGIIKATRNLPGVDTACVNNLSLLDLAPGAHMGRLVIWTEAAFTSLDDIFGSTTNVSKVKQGYTLPESFATTLSLRSILTAPSVLAVLKAKKRPHKHGIHHNALVNKKARAVLLPRAKPRPVVVKEEVKPAVATE